MESLPFAVRAVSALSGLILAFGVCAAFFTSVTTLGFSCLIAGGIIFVLTYGATLYLEREEA